MSGIVDMIRDVMVYWERPVVYISGGLDSTIILHHLVEAKGTAVFTYTAKFGEDDEDCIVAKKVASHYGVPHREVEIRNFVKSLPRILCGFDRPRYNVWVAYLAGQAFLDKRDSVYAGEGADEHFGGYENKNYFGAWADHLSFIGPTYEQVHKRFDLDLVLPFVMLPWRDTLSFYCPPEKQKLREAYRGIIPDEIVNRKKKPPEFSNYWKLWRKEIKPHYPNFNPSSVEDIKEVLQFLATEAWLKANSVKGNRYHVEGDSDSSVHGRLDFGSGSRGSEKTD